MHIKSNSVYISERDREREREDRAVLPRLLPQPEPAASTQLWAAASSFNTPEKSTLTSAI